jgi:hypothetical protein
MVGPSEHTPDRARGDRTGYEGWAEYGDVVFQAGAAPKKGHRHGVCRNISTSLPPGDRRPSSMAN